MIISVLENRVLGLQLIMDPAGLISLLRMRRVLVACLLRMRKGEGLGV